MLSSTAPGTAPDQNYDSSVGKTSLITRKIWLPRLLYDCLPYFYLTAGFSAFFATLYINQWFWVLPHYILFSAGCIHFGVRVFRKRRPGQSAPAGAQVDVAADPTGRTST